MSNAISRHAFTEKIEAVLTRHFGENAAEILAQSPLLGYVHHKTKSAGRGSKSRSAFANHYALYVLVEDYLAKGFYPGGARAGTYDTYQGARFSDLLRRQRELPFGGKLQNHALNTRLNDEFRKFYPSVNKEPIVRDVEKQRYWLHEDLLTVSVRRKDGSTRAFNIAKPIIDIIDAYGLAKKEAFQSFIDACSDIAALAPGDSASAIAFIEAQLRPEVDARVFEIVSFAILKAFYGQQHVYWGRSQDAIQAQSLVLYKTGRTNANDGGIDFVLRPLGMFFQVTETLDATKYFLDIDKIQRFPLTFVVKSTESVSAIRAALEAQAAATYKAKATVDKYMKAIEDIITIEQLLTHLDTVIQAGKASDVMKEIILQSKVEFNYSEDDVVP